MGTADRGAVPKMGQRYPIICRAITMDLCPGS
jgi:hypothetical protein